MVNGVARHFGSVFFMIFLRKIEIASFYLESQTASGRIFGIADSWRLPTMLRMDRDEITFEQAEGTEELPGQLALGTLSKEARALLWERVFRSLGTDRESDYSTGYSDPARLEGDWLEILRDFRVQRLHRPADEFNANWDHQVAEVKRIIMRRSYDKTLGFLEWVLRHKKAPYGLFSKIENALETARVAYVLTDEPPTIVPAASPEEGQAIISALATAKEHGMVGAEEHLRNASNRLRDGDFADSMAESIHAVESTAKRLDGNAKTSLKPALLALQSKCSIHPSLVKAFLGLYGYTSDEQGVRHSILDDPDAVKQVEAVFMLGACASFVTYLINQGREAGLLD